MTPPPPLHYSLYSPLFSLLLSPASRGLTPGKGGGRREEGGEEKPCVSVLTPSIHACTPVHLILNHSVQLFEYQLDNNTVNFVPFPFPVRVPPSHASLPAPSPSPPHRMGKTKTKTKKTKKGKKRRTRCCSSLCRDPSVVGETSSVSACEQSSYTYIPPPQSHKTTSTMNTRVYSSIL